METDDDSDSIMVEMKLGTLGGWNCISMAYLFLYIFANKNAFPAHMCVMVNGNFDLLPFSMILLFVGVCLLVNLRAP